MQEEIEDIRFIQIHDFDEIMNDPIRSQLHNEKVLVFEISSNFNLDPGKEKLKKEVIQYLCNISKLTILVIDCELKPECIDYVLSFDFCLATKQSKITIDTRKIEYFPKENFEFLFGRTEDDDSSSKALVNRLILSNEIKSEVLEFLAPILSNKDQKYIKKLKQYFNRFKTRTPVNLAEIQIHEMIMFCELALQ